MQIIGIPPENGVFKKCTNKTVLFRMHLLLARTHTPMNARGDEYEKAVVYLLFLVHGQT